MIMLTQRIYHSMSDLIKHLGLMELSLSVVMALSMKSSTGFLTGKKILHQINLLQN